MELSDYLRILRRRWRLEGDGDGSGASAAGKVVASLCLLAAGLIVCFGLYLIVA